MKEESKDENTMQKESANANSNENDDKLQAADSFLSSKISNFQALPE